MPVDNLIEQYRWITGPSMMHTKNSTWNHTTSIFAKFFVLIEEEEEEEKFV